MTYALLPGDQYRRRGVEKLFRAKRGRAAGGAQPAKLAFLAKLARLRYMKTGLFSSPAPALLLAFISLAVLTLYPLLWLSLLGVALMALAVWVLPDWLQERWSALSSEGARLDIDPLES